MKLQAVMENLHRQQRAKLLLEQQQAGQLQARRPPPQARSLDGVGAGSPAPESEPAETVALAAMRAAAAGLQRAPDSPVSGHSSAGDDEEDEEEEEEEEGREGHYKDMMGSDEEEHIKQKWDEDDFEKDMEDDYEDGLGEEAVMAGRDKVTAGRGVLLLPQRQLNPHGLLLKARPTSDPEARISSLAPHSSHSQLAAQDHGEWTYEEQFRQLYELDSDPNRKEFLDDLFSFMQQRGTPVNRIPIMAKQVLDLYMLYQLVTEKGGLVEVINKKLWREITKGLNLPTSITSAAFTLRTQYMKYLYPYECDKRGLSNPDELQAAIDSNRREGRRQSFGGSLFTYSPNGTPTMLSSPKLNIPSMGMAMGTNGAALTPIQKIKKEEDGGQAPTGGGRGGGSLPSHSVVAVQAAAAQAAMAAQVAALEQLRDRLEAGEPPEKKMALPVEEHQRLLQRALQQNLLAMTAQMPMNIRISNQAFLTVGMVHEESLRVSVGTPSLYSGRIGSLKQDGNCNQKDCGQYPSACVRIGMFCSFSVETAAIDVRQPSQS
ncbi:AT-rich interactive domain-containing protein 3A isoform X2 [Brienomyrus brachyistius]|uniref:AT-rich interactive domain-containing protein 3A isoform X2 n=1 Tax=Brienomyrus brachyistius TaxID=42636 RepID=UPI0020B4166B|nr:AT-rich interactive domain-containing protein 3A isoform X2 [Brienomyrus brachyistius]